MNLALDSLRSAGFISYDDGAVKPAQLAVVLTGDNKSESDAATGNRGASSPGSPVLSTDAAQERFSRAGLARPRAVVRLPSLVRTRRSQRA